MKSNPLKLKLFAQLASELLRLGLGITRDGRTLMDAHRKHRIGLRTLWVAQGLAIAALAVGPGIASANAFLRPLDSSTVHLGDDVNSTPTDVPEPGSLALFLAGFGGLMIFAESRRRRASRSSASDETR